MFLICLLLQPYHHYFHTLKYYKPQPSPPYIILILFWIISSMTSVSASFLTLQPLLTPSNAIQRNNVMVAPIGWTKSGFPSLKSSRPRISCAAKAETTQKVCDIVRTQLALSAETQLTSESKFSELGADSLDTVEIVMSLEEEFGITVEEDNAQSIATIQDAAELIDKLVQQKAESG